MYIYVLKAEYKSSMMSMPIPARNDFCARVIAAKEIGIKYASDKRLAIGKVTLLDAKGNVVMSIPEQGEEKAAPAQKDEESNSASDDKE